MDGTVTREEFASGKYDHLRTSVTMAPARSSAPTTAESKKKRTLNDVEVSSPKRSSFTDIIKRSSDLNHEWIASPIGRGHYLSGHYQLRTHGDEFVRTSCEITAMMLRVQLVPDVNEFDGWMLLDDGDVPDAATTPVFQISMGVEWSDNEHMVTIANGTLLDSWFKRYPLRARPCDHATAVSRKALFALLSMSDIPASADWKLFFWVPKRAVPQPTEL